MNSAVREGLAVGRDTTLGMGGVLVEASAGRRDLDRNPREAAGRRRAPGGTSGCGGRIMKVPFVDLTSAMAASAAAPFNRRACSLFGSVGVVYVQPGIARLARRRC